jgi:hypothetical protein
MSRRKLYGVIVAVCSVLIIFPANSFSEEPYCFDMAFTSADTAVGTVKVCWTDFAPDAWTEQDVLSEGGSPVHMWTLNSPVSIYGGASSNIFVASLDQFVIETDATDPYVRVQFAITAGASATIFNYDNVVTVNPNLINPQAYATATTTLTDLNGNGATLTGQFDGKLYRALYNVAVPAPPDGTEFTKLMSTYGFVPPTISQTANDRDPAAPNWRQINDTVYNIKGMFSFELSAGDKASGTGTFNVTPEPATMALFALGALILRRTRR